jgi:hypothetical protein
MDININNKLSRQSIHSWVYFICLCLLVASMPTSRYMLSVSQILLGINWLAEGNFKNKFKIFFRNKPAIAFTLIYGLHIVGLLWTEDFHYAITSDLKHKLPLLTLTLVIVTSPALDIKKLRFILFIFVASVLAVSFIGIYLNFTQDLVNYRDILPFVPHLYYSMMLVFSAFLLPWLIKQVTEKNEFLYLSYVISLWLILFVFIIRSLTGIASLAGVIIFVLIWLFIKHKNIFVRISAISVLIIGIFACSTFLIYMYNKVSHKVEVNYSTLDKYTKDGNPYTNNALNPQRENGYLVHIYLAETELMQAWNVVSEIGYYEKDHSEQFVRYTLWRYMTSKGYRKDKEHFAMLSDEDIAAIERGITNHYYIQWPGILVRVHQTMMGLYIYINTKNPNWSSLTQRMDLWKASYYAFIKSPVIGWGTGDIFIAMNYGLEKTDSYMKVHDIKPHSQYILFLLTLGVVGLILFFVFYIYTIIKTKALRFFPFIIFLITFGVNGLGNNPIDAQIGQAMFVFFTLFFGFMYNKEELKSNIN